jgi:hypothetical protein
VSHGDDVDEAETSDGVNVMWSDEACPHESHSDSTRVTAPPFRPS